MTRVGGSGHTGTPTQTKKKTILSYKALYEGPEFETQYQYAQLWILVVMAFVFGPLIPMMFIYCFIGLLVLSVTNHLRLAYSVRREPNYNQKLNRSLLMSLYIGPISYCLVANIVYSNGEIFKNKVTANTSHSNYFAFTNTAFSKSITELNPGIIFSILIYLLVLRGLLILSIFVFRCCCKGISPPKCCKYGNLKFVFFDTTRVKK